MKTLVRCRIPTRNSRYGPTAVRSHPFAWVRLCHRARVGRRVVRHIARGSVMRDVRVCFLGDSFVAGIGDPQVRGWVGRVAERTVPLLGTMTAYNLGVRRDTSADVLARWADECARRLPPTMEGRIVVSFGVNDCAIEQGQRRVEPAQSLTNLAALVRPCRSLPAAGRRPTTDRRRRPERAHRSAGRDVRAVVPQPGDSLRERVRGIA
jgi:hypothetical protein